MGVGVGVVGGRVWLGWTGVSMTDSECSCMS